LEEYASGETLEEALRIAHHTARVAGWFVDDNVGDGGSASSKLVGFARINTAHSRLIPKHALESLNSLKEFCSQRIRMSGYDFFLESKSLFH
jgi:hypothetical protein